MRKCLIVVDVQNDFVTGSLGSPEAQAAEREMVDEIRRRRAEGYDIIFTQDTHSQDYLQTREGNRLPVEHCIEGTEGHALSPAVDAVRQSADRVLKKGTFGSAELFDLLRTEPYDEIELIGLVTDICVMANAVLAKTACPEADVRVDALSTSGTTPEKKEAALDVMRSLQIDVLNTN